jgi:hypothetical protein
MSFQYNRTQTRLRLCFIIWFRYSSDPPVTEHLALELTPSEVTFRDDSLILKNEWNVTLYNFEISECTEMWMTKGNKKAVSQVIILKVWVWKINGNLYRAENLISFVYKISNCYLLTSFLLNTINKIVYLILPVWNLRFHTLGSLTRQKDTNSRRTYHGSSHCALHTG